VFYEPSLQTARRHDAARATAARHADPADKDRASLPEVSEAAEREVRYQASGGFAELLSRLGVSLLVSTYQAGKLAVIGTDLPWPDGPCSGGRRRSPRRSTTSSRRWASPCTG
jgi:hypothetical protein